MTAPYVTRAELQQALDALEDRLGVLIRQLQGGAMLDGGAILASGPWSAAVPGVTTGVVFTADVAGEYMISCEATAFHAAGGTIEIDVYVDGNNAGSMILATATPTNLRVTLPRACINIALTKGDHYIAYRLVSGNTSATDVGSIEVTRVG